MITCYFGPNQQYTKEQLQAFQKGIVIIKEAVTTLWDKIKEMVEYIGNGLREYVNEWLYLRKESLERVKNTTRNVMMQSQVMDNKPKFIRARSNC